MLPELRPWPAPGPRSHPPIRASTTYSVGKIGGAPLRAGRAAFARASQLRGDFSRQGATPMLRPCLRGLVRTSSLASTHRRERQREMQRDAGTTYPGVRSGLPEEGGGRRPGACCSGCSRRVRPRNRPVTRPSDGGHLFGTAGAAAGPALYRGASFLLTGWGNLSPRPRHHRVDGTVPWRLGARRSTAKGCPSTDGAVYRGVLTPSLAVRVQARPPLHTSAAQACRFWVSPPNLYLARVRRRRRR